MPASRAALSQLVHRLNFHVVSTWSSGRGVARVEGLAGEVSIVAESLADACKASRVLRLGHDLPHDVDCLGLEPLQVRQRGRAQFAPWISLP